MTPTLAHIRDVIARCEEVRRTFQRMRPDAFRATDGIGPVLSANIHALKMLAIPESAPILEQCREAEIGAYEDLQRLWLRIRGMSAPLERIEATLVSPDGSRLEFGEGVRCDFETHAEEGTAAHEIAERIYGRGRVVLRVIDGGKKS